MTGPYASAAAAYWQAGWRGIVPLPARAKKNPPSGFTGSTGVDPSYADLDAWATGPEGSGNIALRMPRDVIGIDVDAYGDKLGRQTNGSTLSRYCASGLDAIRIAPSVTRAFEADDDGLEILAFSPRAQGDAEIVQDFSWD